MTYTAARYCSQTLTVKLFVHRATSFALLACAVLFLLSSTVLAGVTAKKDAITLKVGEREKVAVELTGETAGPLKFESGNPGFFTVDSNGVVTAIHEGTSVVSAIAADGTRVDVRVEVVAAAAAALAGGEAAQNVPTEGIRLGNAGGQIQVGRLERIIANVLPYNVIGSNPFNVTSSDPAVLSASNEAKVVTAIKEGTATITVSTPDGKHSASATYTVIPARVESHPADKTYTIDPAKFGIVYDDASEAAAKANSAGIYAALRHTADNGFTRLLLESKKTLYVEPRDTVHMVSNVQLDLNGSEIKLRPNNYARYQAFVFAEKGYTRVLENASIVNGTITGERDEKEKHFPNWAKTPETEGGVSIEFEEGFNNGIRNLTVRKSIGFNIGSGLGGKSFGVKRFAEHPVSVNNMELGGFDDQGKPADAKGLIRTKKPLDITTLKTPYYTIGLPLGYMGYPYANSRIYDVYIFDKEMNLLSSAKGALRYRQYGLPEGAAYMHLAFYQSEVPASGNSDFHNAIAFVDNRAMPINNYMIDCTIEDNYSTGFAACGGQGWLIKGNTFRRNAGRMPGCDIDWEDGWEYMQGDLIEDNVFESRLNVITCAGVGLIFRNNTFRGESVFYGRTQHYSLINNVFEKTEGANANPVKVAFSSQSDIYAAGNRYTNASVHYARQHNKAPFIGTYEATFTGETFDNAAILQGHLTRLVNCTIRNGSENILIGAEQLENCTIDKGSYSIGGVIRGSTATDATFRVLPDRLLTVRNSTLANPSFASGGKSQGLRIENSKIHIIGGDALVQPNQMAEVVIRNSDITFQGVSTFALFGGWSAADAETNVTLDQVRFDVPSGFEGFLHKFSWYPAAGDPKRITYTVQNTDLSKFRRTDEKGESSNAVFNTP